MLEWLHVKHLLIIFTADCLRDPIQMVDIYTIIMEVVHCKKGIVITTDSLLFQIQMSEHNSLLCGGELHDNLSLILSQLFSTLSYHLGN